MSSVLNFVANPVRSYVSSLLVSALSKYIVGIKVNSLGILSQELNLQNVELNLTSIESDLGLKLPFVIKSSFAKSLKIVIPWTSLLSLPVGVYIENLNIELEDKETFNRAVTTLKELSVVPEKDTEDSFNTENPSTEDASNRNETTSKGMWGDRYLKRILANLSIRIDNIIIRYSHEHIHCVLTSKYMEIMSSGPEDGWEYNWQEPRGVKGSIYKSINIGDFSISLDYLRDTNQNSTIQSAVMVDMESNQERIFYPPLVNNLTIHIRCLFSLWEGLLNTMISGSNEVSTDDSGWNIMNLFTEQEVDEIQQYSLYLTKKESTTDHTISYYLHNNHSVYDISYYTNMIDIHIDDRIEISLNPFQLNSILLVLNQILGEESRTVTLNEELPECETPIQESKPVVYLAGDVQRETTPITKKFNVNSIALSIGTIVFSYYMPLHLLPSSYQRTSTTPYTGEEKGAEPSSGIDIHKYGVDKNHLKSVMEATLSGIECVANLYDNQFYRADILMCLHSMTVNLGGKPFLSWNQSTTEQISKSCNHICMFGNESFVSDFKAHTHSLHHSKALYFRFKAYSAPYHDFLIDTRQNREEVLPAGCLEFFCNSLHITKEKTHLPVLITIIRHIVPLHLKSPVSSDSKTTSSSPVTVSHNDYFIQCGVSDFSFSYATSSSVSNPFIPAPSQLLSIQLKNLSTVLYNNYSCPCCPRDAGECVASVNVDGFFVIHGIHSMLTLSQFTFHFVNNANELSINSFCDDLRISLDSSLLSTITILINELLSCFSRSFIQSFSLSHTYSLVLSSFYLYSRVLKDQGIITSQVTTQTKALLRSLQLSSDDTVLVAYPSSQTGHDTMSNAFEFMMEYDGHKSSENAISCVSSAVFIDVYQLFKFVQELLTLGTSYSSLYSEVPATSQTQSPSPSQSPSSSELPSFIEFNIDLRDCLMNMHSMSIVTNECVLLLYESIHLRFPSVTIMNNMDHSDECSVIMKQFIIDMDSSIPEPLLTLSDLCLLFNFADWTLTLSSSDFKCMITPNRLSNLLTLSSHYSSLLSHLKTDVAIITHSIEEVEVVTENTLFIRNSVDRSSSIDSYGLRKRRSSVSRTCQAQPELSVVVEKPEEVHEEGMLSKIRMSYNLERVTIGLNCEETERPIGQCHTLILGHLNVNVNNKEGEILIDSVQMNCGSQMFLQSNRDAVTIHGIWSSDLEVTLGVNLFVMMLRLEVLHSLVRDALYCASLIPSHPSQSQNEDSIRLTTTFSITDSIIHLYSHQSPLYQLKLVMFQLQYDQLRMGSQLLNLQLQHLFLADTSNRLLITDGGLQIDLERSIYRTGNEISIQMEVPDLQMAFHHKDIEAGVSLLQETWELFHNERNSNAPSSDPSLHCEYVVKILVHSIHAQLLDASHSLDFVMEHFHVSYDTQCEDVSARLLSIASLRCDFDHQSCLIVNSCRQEKDEMMCLCIDREVREKDARIWNYLFIGDFYGCVTPSLLQFLVVDSYRLLLPLIQLFASSPSSSSSPSHPSSPPLPSSSSLPSNSNQKHGFSLVTQSIQCQLAVPNQASFLLTLHSLNGMHTSSVTHLELNQCRILIDSNKNAQSISLLSSQHPILEECTFTLNLDTNESTKHITLDTGDLILTVDDRVIAQSSVLLHSFSSILSSIPTTSDLPVTTTLHTPSDLPSTPSKPFRFDFTSEEEQPKDLPMEFPLTSLTLVVQDAWPEVGQLVVVPAVIPLEGSTTDDHVTNFPSLDYYRIINGGVPQPQSSEMLREQLRRQYQPQMKRSSFFSFLNSTSEETCSPCYVSMQFRLAHTVRVFSVMISSLDASRIDSLTHPGFSQLLGDTLEFDLLAWSDVDRCFRCVKTICVPIESISTQVARDRSQSVASSYRDGDYRSDVTNATDTSGSTVSEALAERITSSTSTTEFFELAAPYSYSSRYQIQVHLNSYRSSLQKKLGGSHNIIRYTAELIRSTVSLTYFISFFVSNWDSFMRT